MLSLLSDQFYWTQMATHCQQYIAEHEMHCLFKDEPERTPMKSIMAFYLLQLVNQDYLTLDGVGEQVLNGVVITNHFRRCAQAYMTISQTAQITTKEF